MYDYHMHTAFSGDADFPMDEMIESAIARGLDGIAVTDHADPYFPCEARTFDLDFPAYEAALLEAAAGYGDKIDFAKGIELGMQLGPALEVCETAVSRFPYDFVIASIHASKGKCIHLEDYTEGKSLAEVIEDYYTDLLDCITLYKNYDVLGHLNVIDRYTEGYAPAGVYLPYVEEILRVAVADGKGIEINTSATRYGLERGTPAREIIDLFAELGGEIVTTGSDAHRPADVGADIEKGEQMILASGLKYVATFKNRQPIFHKIG